MVTLFPDPYLHIGGDETVQTRDGKVEVATVPSSDVKPAEKVSDVKQVSAAPAPPSPMR